MEFKDYLELCDSQKPETCDKDCNYQSKSKTGTYCLMFNTELKPNPYQFGFLKLIECSSLDKMFFTNEQQNGF